MAERAKRQPQDSLEFWTRHLADCRRSGLSYAEYGRRHDLAECAFGYWRKKASAQSEEKPQFVERWDLES